MRAFIALEIPEQIKQTVEKIQQELKQSGFQAHWVKPKTAHLTLAFLGSITSDKIRVIEKILKEVACQIKPVKIQLYKIDFFPSLNKREIIFVNLKGELGKLNALSLKIRRRLKEAGIYFDEKKFVAHLTLGRIKNHQNNLEKINKIKFKRIKFVAKKISLIKSQLTKGGPIYKTIKCVFLG